MKNTPNTQMLINCVSKDETRPNIQVIKQETNRTYSTDCHRAFIVNSGSEECYWDKKMEHKIQYTYDYPNINMVIPDTTKMASMLVLFPAIISLIKAKKGVCSNLYILESGHVDIVKPESGKYATINACYIADLLKAFDDYSKSFKVYINFDCQSDPLVITDIDETFKYLVMQIKN